MAAKPVKPTKAQLAEAKIRAAASGISMNQSAKGLRNASKAIVAGASMLPAGRAVKAAATIAKSTAKSTVKKKLAEPSKASVKVKPAAKQKPNPKNDDKMLNKNFSSWSRNYGPEKNNDTFIGKARNQRIMTSNNQTASGRASRPVDSPRPKSNKPVIKINSQRNLKKK